MSFVAELEPRAVWQHFDEILKIPRGSGNEEGMRKYVLAIAEKHGLASRQDQAGNVVVMKPGVAGRGDKPVVVLQSHLDMVNEKNSDVVHDFEKDPIVPRLEGEYLKATGTTLGSDNGIGVAAALAVLEAANVQHGPLELLFTIDEETGLTGAGNLAADMLSGKTLINLDTEEEGALYVGCAGGAGTEIFLPLKENDAPEGHVALRLKLAGLRGGHSGVDIHLQRGNANKLLARALYRVRLEAKIKFRLAAFHGGNKHNAIPREAFALVLVPRGEQKKFQAEVKAQVAALQAEYAASDPNLALTGEKAKAKTAWSNKTTAAVLGLINALPHGVLMMSNDIPGLVETSTNLAIVEMKKKKLRIHCSTRSSVTSALQGVRDQIRAVAEAFGAKAEEEAGYPGWKPNLQSHVLQVAQQVHRQLFGAAPGVKAIHAGLECGIIGEKYPGMDMVSLGPQIEFPHSPDERVKISSVGNFYKLLLGVLERLAA
jgi:dipeptidase D